MAFLDKFPPETPLRRVASVRQLNRIVNILMDIEGIGVTVQKDFAREGRGWKIVVEPSSTASSLLGIQIFPAATQIEYVLARKADGEIGWRAVTDDCDTAEDT